MSTPCSLTRYQIPSYRPVINGLSQNRSKLREYALIYINGSNFFPNGSSYVNFGDIKNIPVTYYNSFNISFIVPVNAIINDYNITVVNIYNGNYSNPVKYTYPASLIESNSVSFTIL
jgi:hypothetical protein